MEQKVSETDIEIFILDKAIYGCYIMEANHILTSIQGQRARQIYMRFLNSFIEQLRRDLNIYTEMSDVLSAQTQWYLSGRYSRDVEQTRNLFREQYQEALNHSRNILEQQIQEIPNTQSITRTGLVATDVPAILCYDDSCAICMLEEDNSPVNIQLSPCDHCFHEDCIKLWLLQKRSCPVCKSAVKKIYRSPKNVIMF